MLNFWKDIQYAFRTLAKNPGFAIIAIVTLALGMAANTTIFTVVNGLILRPLSVPRPEQITVLALQQAGTAGLQGFSYPDFLDLRSQSVSIGDLITYRVSSLGSPWKARATTASSAASRITTFPSWESLRPPAVLFFRRKESVPVQTPSWFLVIPTGRSALRVIQT